MKRKYEGITGKFTGTRDTIEWQVVAIAEVCATQSASNVGDHLAIPFVVSRLRITPACARVRYGARIEFDAHLSLICVHLLLQIHVTPIHFHAENTPEETYTTPNVPGCACVRCVDPSEVHAFPVEARVHPETLGQFLLIQGNPKQLLGRSGRRNCEDHLVCPAVVHPVEEFMSLSRAVQLVDEVRTAIEYLEANKGLIAPTLKENEPILGAGGEGELEVTLEVPAGQIEVEVRQANEGDPLEGD